MDPEVRQLRALVAVVDSGTFTAAADELGLTQATVSRQVAALERTLGIRVLRRTTREVALTPAGAQVVGHARRALEEVAALARVGRAPHDLRVGYAWSALGEHTTAVQRRWTAAHPGSALLFVQSNTPTTGLSQGLADVGVHRRPVHDDRLRTALVGHEARYAAVAADDPLAQGRTVVLAALAERTVAVDPLTGTTSEELWPPPAAAPALRPVRGVDDWLTLIAAGQAVGVTAAATAAQHRRPGVVYRRVRDAPPVAVRLAWWADSPPPGLAALISLVREAYGTPRAARPVARPAG